ncbi:hypothetical protein GCM10009596_23410 [Arthrobacter rhombi]|uniref:HNH endonuclease signature motif containing protein n=1 Tax=Arthrobacter rhombi TaxID=71253 RepID=UPI0031D4157A
MEQVADQIEVTGWGMTRLAGSSVTGSARLKAAEALARFAEAEKFRAAAMLHDEAQRAVEPRLEALEGRSGMQISLRTGRTVLFAATDSAAMEIALVAGLSQGQAHRVLDQAETLVMDTPEVLESLALGRIGASHVQRILEHTRQLVPEPLPLPPATADEATKQEWEREMARRAAKARADRRDFGADMLAAAPGKSPAQLRARGRQLLEKYYGVSYTQRSRTELRDRRITLEEANHGMTWFSGYLPTASCQAIFSKIDSMARLLTADPDSAAAVVQAAAAAGNGETDLQAMADPAEVRTLDQLRADVFTDMMLNGPRGQGLETVNAEVFVAIPSTMLPGTPGGPLGGEETGIDGPPPARGTVGEDLRGVGGLATAQLAPGAPVPTLLGAGPIDQGSAAQLMTAAKTWWRLITDPITGAILEFGQDRYRPTPAQRAALRFRDGGCATPGCTGPARNCEVDHTREWQDGGGTDIANTQLRCKRCHRLKSLGLIEVEQCAGGTVLVTSLFGTQRVGYPAAPWAVGGGQQSLAPPDPAGLPSPPMDPDAVIPSASAPQPGGPADPGVVTLTRTRFLTTLQWERWLWKDLEPNEPRDLYGTESRRIESDRYQSLQISEWGRVHDVPDSSCADPEHGRYARSRWGKATRKRRLKRLAGGYGPPVIQRPDDRDNPWGGERPPLPPTPDEPPF